MTSTQGLGTNNTEDRSDDSLLSSVHFFNPGYEATLERGIEHFTPSKSVQQFRRDCALLPIYLPESTARVIETSRTDVIYDVSAQTHFPISDHTTLNPWGWAPELKGIFPHLSLPYSIEDMRYLGSRLRSVELWHLVFDGSPDLFEPSIDAPIVITDSLPPASLKRDQNVVKSEFSSSGRGVQFTDTKEQTLRIIEQKRGKGTKNHIIIEPRLSAHSDRGYEFYRDLHGVVHYLGGSDFRTESGRYVGNYLTSPEQLEASWQAMPTTPTHTEYVALLTRAFNALDLRDYTGLLGVDTMVYTATDGRLYISPCIEVNVRPTMGHIALELSRRYVGDRSGFFSIKFRSAPLHLTSDVPVYQLKTPLTTGDYPLTPISDETQFIAHLRID